MPPDDPKPAADAGGVATTEALDEVAALRDRVMQSAVQTEEANRRAAAAEGAAAEAVQAANRATAAVEQVTTTSRVSGELETANREMAEAKSAYKAAFSAGDADAMADAQEKIARTGAKIDRLGAQPAPAARPAADTGRVQQRQDGQGDAFENFLATRSAPTAAWIRQNRQHFQDPVTNGRIVTADRMWDKTGKPKDTPEYFTFIEKEAGLAGEPAQEPAARPGNGGRADPAGTRADTGTAGAATTLTPAGAGAGANATLPDGRRAPPQAGRQRAAPVAAPPNRDGAPNLNGRGGSGEKRITPEMQAWAKIMYPPTKDNPDGGIDPELYYDEFQRLKDEGEINDRFGRG